MNRHYFIRQSIQLGILRIVGAVIALLVNLMLARFFQPEEVGEYFLSLGLVVFVSQCATLGSEKWLVKNLAVCKNSKEIKEKLSLAFFLVLVGALLSYCLYCLLLVKLFPIDNKLNILECYSVALFFIVIAIFQANNKAPIGLLIQYVLQPLLFTSLILFCSASLIELYLTSIILCLIVAAMYLFQIGFLRLGKFQIVKILPTFQCTFPYFSVMLVGLLVTHLSLPLSSLWLDNSSLAVMGTVSRLINILFFSVTGTRMLLLPLFSRAIANDDSKEVFYLSYWGSIFPTIIVAIGIVACIFFSEQIMRLFGEVYMSYHYLLVLSSLILLPAAYWGWSQSF